MTQHHVESTPMSVLTQSLLNEKNSEIDELTTEVERLSTELERMRASKTEQPRGALLSAQVIFVFESFLLSHLTAWFRLTLSFLLSYIFHSIHRCFSYITLHARCAIKFLPHFQNINTYSYRIIISLLSLTHFVNLVNALFLFVQSFAINLYILCAPVMLCLCIVCDIFW